MLRLDISNAYIASIYVPAVRPGVNRGSGAGISENRQDELGGEGIQRRTIRLPKDLHASLRALAYVTDDDERRLAIRAVEAYLDGEGHDAAVVGFGERARTQHRVALDRLHDP